MTANRELAELRGLDEETIIQIDSMHTYLETLMEKYIKLGFSESRKEEIHDVEYILQKLWGFPEDRGYHTWAPLYQFKCQWVGRKFRCTKTGTEVALTQDVVRPKRFVCVGEGAIDLGTLSYSRMVGSIEEICVECGNSLSDLHKLDCNEQWRDK